MNENKLSLSINVNKMAKFSSYKESDNEKFRNNTSLMFERLLNNKNKFTLDDHFDKRNSATFLLEKEKYLSPIDIDDGDCPSETIEKTRSKIEIFIPNGAPTKYTFGQN